MSLEKFADMIFDDLTRDDEKICPNCENAYSEDDVRPYLAWDNGTTSFTASDFTECTTNWKYAKLTEEE